MGSGGLRKNAGRKPRHGVAVSRHINLSLTVDEYTRLAARCPKDTELATWLRGLLLARLAELKRRK